MHSPADAGDRRSEPLPAGHGWQPRHSPAAVAGDDLDAGMCAEPGFHGGRLAIGRQVDRLPPFQVADHRAVTLPLAPCPVIDADHTRGFGGGAHPVPRPTQERVFACRHQKAPGERLRRSSAEGKTEVTHKILQTRGASHMRSGDAGREPFSEDPGRAAGRAAAKATNPQDDFHGSPMRRNIGRARSIPTVDMVRNAPALWTGARDLRRTGMDADRIAIELNLIGRKPCRQKIPA